MCLLFSPATSSRREPDLAVPLSRQSTLKLFPCSGLMARVGSSSAAWDLCGVHLVNLTICVVWNKIRNNAQAIPALPGSTFQSASLGKETVPDEQLLNFWCILKHAENRAHAYKKLDNWSLSGLMWKVFSGEKCRGMNPLELWRFSISDLHNLSLSLFSMWGHGYISAFIWDRRPCLRAIVDLHFSHQAKCNWFLPLFPA